MEIVVVLLFLIVIRLYEDDIEKFGDFVGEILASVFIFICKWIFKPIFLLLAYPIVLVILIVTWIDERVKHNASISSNDTKQR